MKLRVLFFYHGADILGGWKYYESEVVSDETTPEAAQKAAKEAFFRDLDPWKRRSIYECEVYEGHKLLWQWSDEKATKETMQGTGWKIARQKTRAFVPLKIENEKWVRNGPPYVPEKR